MFVLITERSVPNHHAKAWTATIQSSALARDAMVLNVVVDCIARADVMFQTFMFITSYWWHSKCYPGLKTTFLCPECGTPAFFLNF